MTSSVLKLIGVIWFVIYSSAVIGTPKVLVSVSPLHSLVTQLMHGAGEPELLLDDNIDLHHFSYKPSDINKLHVSEIFIWIADGFEPDIASYIASGVVSGQSLELTKAIPKQALVLIEGGSQESLFDPHLWLSPDTMNKAMHIIADKLVVLDPINAQIYLLNLAMLSGKLQSLSANLLNAFKPYQAAEFAVYHNAYAYFIKEAKLQQPLVLESSAHGQLSLNSLSGLIKEAVHKPECVVVSDSDPVNKLRRVMKTLEVKTVELVGIRGGDYFDSMQQLITDFRGCFEH